MEILIYQVLQADGQTVEARASTESEAEYQKRACSKGPPCKCKDGKPLPTVCPDQKIPECCKDEDFFKYQMRGKDRLEQWPKPEMPHGNWHSGCPQAPHPPTYDPYRIKTPDILVPPLPKSNAKDNKRACEKELFSNPDKCHACADNSVGAITDLFHNSAIVHPYYWTEPEKKRLPSPNQDPEATPRLGYHGKAKFKFAFHEPWRPLDRLTLLEQAEKDEEDHSEEREAIDKVDKTPHGL